MTLTLWYIDAVIGWGRPSHSSYIVSGLLCQLVAMAYPGESSGKFRVTGDRRKTAHMAVCAVALMCLSVFGFGGTAHARSATGRIGLPPSYTVNATPELISQWLSSVEIPEVPGTQVVSVWHGLTNFPQFIRWTFVNTQTGDTFTLWNSDTVTVTDSNGWTAKFQWEPLSSIQWVFVPDSIRDENGNAPSSTTSQNTVTGQTVSTH